MFNICLDGRRENTDGTPGSGSGNTGITYRGGLREKVKFSILNHSVSNELPVLFRPWLSSLSKVQCQICRLNNWSIDTAPCETQTDHILL